MPLLWNQKPSTGILEQRKNATQFPEWRLNVLLVEMLPTSPCILEGRQVVSHPLVQRGASSEPIRDPPLDWLFTIRSEPFDPIQQGSRNAHRYFDLRDHSVKPPLSIAAINRRINQFS
ncbi:MAG: hypothetical protein NTZ94_07055 [Verrucomicrobia bacterium]|nr:hypothetical protein [Verrucomicrobiota bacterium]